ncbi:putative phospholipid ABC transporter permease protein MlaE [Methyloligella halotolerans]|uniref:Putative phospholipid ABC transporter permease protein MlaE n=1 Tax=Methyloligella halotolerans TaxID=1177755 RepID=A0A1E2S046_9HYPH|nr:ABC transporter permease [Methyloligella halotolerans]ODA67857.1 putative phospholipid ABC transporter permease protein MlaE [Methyloligella halotolerans]
MSGEALLTSRFDEGVLALTAGGAWTARNAGELERLLEAQREDAGAAKSISIDMSGVREFDSFGAWLLERLTREWQAEGGKLTVERLPEQDHGLLAEIRQVNQTPREQPRRSTPLLDGLARFGRGGASVLDDTAEFANMLGAISVAGFRVLGRIRNFRLTSLVNQLDRVAWHAIPIIVLITLLIGGIIAQQGIFHFRRFGAEDYAIDLVGVLVIREVGVLIVAIMVAGRSGSSYTAELGSMMMREEIDALRTMGFNPVEVLMLPRVLALTLALPVLTFIGSMAALLGGGIVAWVYGGMSPDIYIARLSDILTVDHFKVGMIKAPFMGLAIGIVACAQAMKVKGSAESLGLQTTISVVKSIFLVIVLDGFFAIFFASIGI